MRMHHKSKHITPTQLLSPLSPPSPFNRRQVVDLDVDLLDKKIDQMMPELGFKQEDNDRLVASFSGGWQMRMCLGKLLLQVGGGRGVGGWRRRGMPDERAEKERHTAPFKTTPLLWTCGAVCPTLPNLPPLVHPSLQPPSSPYFATLLCTNLSKPPLPHPP